MKLLTSGEQVERKPNGEPLGTFLISVDDGYVEWQYRFAFGDSFSIEEIVSAIREKFGATESGKHIRTEHWPDRPRRYFR